MPDTVLPQSRVVRRRNPRPINSCVECRTRKSRCSKTHPCQNCTAFGRECVFITVPESAARRKQREREHASRSSIDWSQQIPVRTQQSTSAQPAAEASDSNLGSASASGNTNTTTPGTPPRDYEWEAYQQDVQVDHHGDAWEKLPAEPEETPDDVYEDENDDEDEIATDLTIRIGRMIICENITGFFRPQYAEEVAKPTLLACGWMQMVLKCDWMLRLFVAWETPRGAPAVEYIVGSGAESTSVFRPAFG